MSVQSQIRELKRCIKELEIDLKFAKTKLKNLQEKVSPFPRRHATAWEAPEDDSLKRYLAQFLRERAEIHQRTIRAIGLRIVDKKWLLNDKFYEGVECED